MHRWIFDDVHEEFRSSMREFADRHIRPNMAKFDEQRFIDRDVWVEAGKQGFLGLQIPEAYGGAGIDDYRFTAIAGEELSAVSASPASSFGIHADVVAPYLVELTTEDQKQRWLPRFATGELITAIGMSEPSGGSDLAALKTHAVKDGADWILNGSKTFITNGFRADLVVVAARTDPAKGAKGITLFAVEECMTGFERGRKLDKVGHHASDTSELFFTDVRVPAENVIGDVDRGFIHMMERLPQERIGAAVGNVGHAWGVLQETLAYVKERRAFGQSIGSFQANKHLLAECVTKLEVSRAYVDTLVMRHVNKQLTAVDAAKAKWWTAQVENEVIDACLQLHGGYGYMTEYRVARAWQDARVTKIWAGSNEIMKEIIGRDLGL